MAHKNAPHAQFNTSDKAKKIWDVNSKIISYVGIGIIVVIAAFSAYRYLVIQPKTEKSNDVVFITQKYFSQFANDNAADDSTRALEATKVLNGDGTNPGALKIINQYSGTPAANLCQYYAGACYLSLGQYDKAVTHLKKFKSGGATQIESRQYGMLGDAYAELKNQNEALKYYKKAADVNTKDDFTSSEFLFRAATYALTVGKTDDAVGLFKELKEKYPMTDKAGNAEKYLAKLGQFSD